jgi:6-phosphogluconolactonase (cycloisomerase 2 family)
MRRRLFAATVVVLVAAAPVRAVTGLANVQRLFTDEFPDISTPEGVVLDSPAGAFVYVAAPSGGVAVFARDAGTGKLTQASVVNDTTLAQSFRPRTILMGPSSTHVYVGDDVSGMRVFLRDGLTGALTLAQSPATQRIRIEDLAISPDGANLYAVARSDDTLEVFARDGFGLLTSVQLLEDGVGGVQGLNGAAAVVVSPDGKHVYVGNGVNSIALFQRDPFTGLLTFDSLTAETVPDTLEDVNDLDVSPDGQNLYAAPEDSSVGAPTVFTRDALTGALTFLQTGPLDPFGRPSPFTVATRAVTVSADGGWVIGVNRQTVSLYARNGSGTLDFVGAEAQAGERVVTTLDDAHVYVASGGSTLGVFRRLEAACTPMPLAGCRTPTLPQKSTVRWKDDFSNTNDKFDWRWSLGQATGLADVGDPIDGLDDVVVCAYDASTSTAPVFHTVAPAGGDCGDRFCWKTRGNTVGRRQLKYKDPGRRPDGLDRFDLKEGATGFARLKVKGKSRFLTLPTLPLVPPVIVQLQAATGECWEATFTTPKKNTLEEFKAKSD